MNFKKEKRTKKGRGVVRDYVQRESDKGSRTGLTNEKLNGKKMEAKKKDTYIKLIEESKAKFGMKNANTHIRISFLIAGLH